MGGSTKKNTTKITSEKNSLVKNINAKKKAGTSNTKNKSSVSKKDYNDMKDNWGKL